MKINYRIAHKRTVLNGKVKYETDEIKVIVDTPLMKSVIYIYRYLTYLPSLVGISMMILQQLRFRNAFSVVNAKSFIIDELPMLRLLTYQNVSNKPIHSSRYNVHNEKMKVRIKDLKNWKIL